MCAQCVLVGASQRRLLRCDDFGFGRLLGSFIRVSTFITHSFHLSLDMDKYYEMFRDKNEGNKKDLFNNPDSPDHSDQDSDAHG